METNLHPSSSESGSSARSSFDPVSLVERVGGDMDLLRELCDLFAEECPLMLADIENAVKQGNAADLRQASHKMKGSVMQFSAATAATIAAALEEMGSTGSLTGATQEYLKLRTELASLLVGLKSMVSEDPAL